MMMMADKMSNIKNESTPTPRSKRSVRFHLDDDDSDSDDHPTPSNDVGRQRDVLPSPFWFEDPNVLLDSRYALEFYPVESMSFSRKLNAVTRSIVVLTILALFFTQNVSRMLFVSLLCITAVWGTYEYYRPKTDRDREGFRALALGDAYLDDSNIESGAGVIASAPSGMMFQQPSPENPFSNVLVSDYDNHPNKLPAPPIADSGVNQLVKQSAMQTVQQLNPGQPGINDKLFRDVNEQLNFEQSMRPFYSTPITTIPNDQGAFAQFCYGDMISCKEGDMFACTRNAPRYTLY